MKPFIVVLLALLSGCASSIPINNQTIEKYYPNRTTNARAQLPTGFLDYRPSSKSNWLMVENLNGKKTFADLSSIREKTGSPLMFILMKTTGIKGYRIDKETVTEEYTWRAIDCVHGDQVVYQTIFTTNTNMSFQYVFDSKPLPHIDYKDFQIDISCVKF